MIKAQELRIGNYVTTINRGGEVHMPTGITEKIGGIDFFRVKTYDYKKPFASQKHHRLFAVADIAGITLTEEWLIRLGLKKMPESEYTCDTYDLAGFKLWMNNGKFLFNDNIEIKHVHRIQNLYFDLKNEELTLKELTPKK